MCVTLQSNSRAKDNSDPSVIYNKIYGQEGLQIKFMLQLCVTDLKTGQGTYGRREAVDFNDILEIIPTSKKKNCDFGLRNKNEYLWFVVDLFSRFCVLL